MLTFFWYFLHYILCEFHNFELIRSPDLVFFMLYSYILENKSCFDRLSNIHCIFPLLVDSYFYDGILYHTFLHYHDIWLPLVICAFSGRKSASVWRLKVLMQNPVELRLAHWMISTMNWTVLLLIVFDKTHVQSFDFNTSNSVVPLQSYTNERS